jgi:glucokinase
MQFLAGDIGGTNSRLWLLESAGGDWRTVDAQVFDSGEHPSFEAVLRQFLNRASWPRLASACLAIAGPVHERDGVQTVDVTNLPWRLDSRALAAAFSIPRLRLINDFQAIGHAIARLAPPDLAVLQPGAAHAAGPRAVLGAGTGLGQALLLSADGREQSIATEGGHVDFAPTDALQIELLGRLLERQPHVSYEHLLSGAGLVRLYEFVRARGVAAESVDVAHAMEREDPAAVITRTALAGSDRLCVEALDLFVRIYGAQAGNLALAAGATGGVYVAGGIAPRILDKLTDGSFITAFRAKGRMRGLLKAIPVRVIVNPAVGLIGAAACAAGLATGPVSDP